MKTYFLPLAILSLTAFTGCVNRDAQEQAKRQEKQIKDPTLPVVVASPVQRDLTENMLITGQIVTSDDTSVAAKVGGRLVSVYIKQGDFVQAGQVIAQQESGEAGMRYRQALAGLRAAQSQLQQALNDAQVGPKRSSGNVRAAEAQVAQARASLARLRKGDRPEQRRQVAAQVNAAKTAMDNAKKSLERFRGLFREGAVSQQEVEQYETAYSVALSNYEQALELQRIQQTGARPEDLTVAEQQLRAAEEALRIARAGQGADVQLQMRVDAARSNVEGSEESVSLARQAMDDTSIRSPFTGQVADKPLQPGAVLGPGTPIARIIGNGGVYFEGDVPEVNLEKVQPGTNVVVRLDAIKGKTFNALVKSVSPTGSSVGRIFKVRIQILYPTPEVRPGMFAKGEIPARIIAGAVVVPTSAVLTDGSGQFVMVADGEKAKKVRVVTGLRVGAEIAVSGLKTSDKLIVKGQEKVIDGTPIAVGSGNEETK